MAVTQDTKPQSDSSIQPGCQPIDNAVESQPSDTVKQADVVAGTRASTAVSSDTPASSTTYDAYLTLMKQCWPSMPSLTLEYRDLSYTIPIKLDQPSSNLLTSVTSGLVSRLKQLTQSNQDTVTQTIDFHAIQHCSGVLKPGSMTLVLAPPGHGKSLFLKALAGRLHTDPLMSGEVLYNGLTYTQSIQSHWYINKLVTYIHQVDVHDLQLTVRETFQFAVDNSVADVKCLDPLYMDGTFQKSNNKKKKKVEKNDNDDDDSASNVEKAKQSQRVKHLQTLNPTDVMIQLMGLTECQDTIIGNDLIRGVSGGQRKRVTIGELMCTPTRVLCCDEISTGLDSSAAFDVNSALQRWSRITDGTVITTLNQPTPEVFDLFDDLILMSEGTIIYHGPRAQVLSYFQNLGIAGPPDNQDLADWLCDFVSAPISCFNKNLAAAQRKSEMPMSKSALIRQQTGQSSQRHDSLRQPAAASPSTHPARGHINQLVKANSVDGPDADEDGLHATMPFHTQVTFHDGNAHSYNVAVAISNPIHIHDQQEVSISRVKHQLNNNSSEHLHSAAPHHRASSEQKSSGGNDLFVPSLHHQQSDSVKAVEVSKQVMSRPISDIPLNTIALLNAFRSSHYWYALNHQLDQTDHLRGKAQHCFAIHQFDGKRPSMSSIRDNPVDVAFTNRQYRQPYVHSFMHHSTLCLKRQMTIMMRDHTMIASRIGQAIFMGLVLGSLFWNLSAEDYNTRLGLLVFAPVFLSFGGVAYISPTADAKRVVNKQQDADFYPAMAYTNSVLIQTMLLLIPETVLFGSITYFMASFTAETGPFCFFVLACFLLALQWIQLLRSFAWCFHKEIAEQIGGPIIALSLLLAGFLITREKIPNYLIEFYYLSSFSWVVRSLAQNEFGTSRYDELTSSGQRKGDFYLSQWELQTDSIWKWMGIVYIGGFFIICFIGGTYALSKIRQPLSQGTKRLLSDQDDEQDNNQNAAQQQQQQQLNDGIAQPDKLRQVSVSIKSLDRAASALPFDPIDLTWKNLFYTVKTESGDDKVLLTDVSGYARHGECTALMGSSGAGKTTLMDVIAGLKTAGKMQGQILLNGHPKDNKTFNRVMGYVQQNDIHLPEATVREAIMFSAKLRLPSSVTDKQRDEYVNQVLNMLELTEIEDSIVGGLSPGRAKLLTIGVELAANPTILFSDEATSGLDSRAALLVMKVLKRIAASGRTVVCTVHQPSAELFMQFDRLLLLRSGGCVTYFDELGSDGDTLVEYFTSAPVDAKYKVPLKHHQNPASWMIDFIGGGTSAKSDKDAPDYAQVYRNSESFKTGQKMIDELSQPLASSKPIAFDSVYAADYLTQCREVLKRTSQSYYRNVHFNMTRFALVLFQGILFGLVFRDIGQSDAAALQSKMSAIFMALGTIGIVNCSSAFPILYRNRAVFYREKASFTYNPIAYSLGMIIIELPYILITVFLFTIPFYFLVGLKRDADAFFDFILAGYLCGLNFGAVGQLLISALPNMMLAAIFQGLLFTFVFLFGGVFITLNAIPDAWKFVYWINWLAKACVVTWSKEFECEGEPCQTISIPPASGQGPNQLHTVQQYVEDHLSIGYGTDYIVKYNAYALLTYVIITIAVILAIQKLSFLKR